MYYNGYVDSIPMVQVAAGMCARGIGARVHMQHYAAIWRCYNGHVDSSPMVQVVTGMCARGVRIRVLVPLKVAILRS